MTVKDRLLQFMEHVNMSQGRFEKHVGLSNGFVNNIGDGISSKSISKIKAKFPELNTTWLLNGDGEMITVYEEYNIGIAMRKVEATADVTLAAVAEILARLTDKTVTSVRDDLEKMVRNKLNPSE
jgi:hypothetical protein